MSVAELRNLDDGYSALMYNMNNFDAIHKSGLIHVLSACSVSSSAGQRSISPQEINNASSHPTDLMKIMERCLDNKNTAGVVGAIVRIRVGNPMPEQWEKLWNSMGREEKISLCNKALNC